METTNQIKIEILEKEVEHNTANIEKCQKEIRDWMNDIVRHELNREGRAKTIAESERKLEAFKKNIPDFSEKTGEMYMEYMELKKDYENEIEFGHRIEEKVKLLKEKVAYNEERIKDSQESIEDIKKALAEAQSEETNQD